jgi:hypothetical protein
VDGDDAPGHFVVESAHVCCDRRETKRTTVDKSEHNPAPEDLELLSGEWHTELSRAAFFPGLDDTAHGHVTVGWIEHGAFLVMRQSERSGNLPSAGGPSAGRRTPPTRSATPTAEVCRASTR